MSRATLLRWAFLTLLAGGLSSTLGDRASAAAGSPETDTQALQRRLADALSENAKLRDQNAKLRDENAALEKHLLDIGDQLKQLAIIKAPPPNIVIPPLKWAPPADTLPQSEIPQPLPKGWSERQFNGVPYYVIPLQSSSPNQATAIKP